MILFLFWFLWYIFQYHWIWYLPFYDHLTALILIQVVLYVWLWFQPNHLHTTESIIWHITWWRHQMETFSALLAICAGNSLPGEFPAQRPATRSFDVFVDLRPNKRLSKQSWGLWSETPSSSLWRHRNEQQLRCCWYFHELFKQR